MEFFDAIMDKHRPSFIPKKGADGYDVIRFSINSWSSMEAMIASNAYGGSSIHYPDYGDNWGGYKGASQAYQNKSYTC
ncbi:MAG: hypothetical protein LBF57_03710 [Holosporaceae bacterium]|nr:hypothetical protein [Holosporaceae bacterium]